MERDNVRERNDYEGSGGNANSIGLLLGGIGIGALLMYLLDPDRGRGRRARLADQLTSKVNRMSEAAEAKARDLRNRAQGMLHEAGSLLPRGASAEGSRQDSGGANEEASPARTAG